MSRYHQWLLSAPLVVASLLSCATTQPSNPWTELFDGQSLTNWQSTNFGGEGEVGVRDGAMHLGMGSPMTGVTLTSTPPSGDYELEVIASRIEGTDFFCGLTFPVRGSHLTLILGGWGGSVCGLSSIDGSDAARNATRSLKGFELGQDYTAHVSVTKDAVVVTLDGEVFLQTKLDGHELGLRPEVTLCKPLGVTAFNTRSRIRSIRWRSMR